MLRATAKSKRQEQGEYKGKSTQSQIKDNREVNGARLNKAAATQATAKATVKAKGRGKAKTPAKATGTAKTTAKASQRHLQRQPRRQSQGQRPRVRGSLRRDTHPCEKRKDAAPEKTSAKHGI